MPVIEVVQKVWVPEVPDIELPYEDGEPLESHWHRLQINLFGDVLDQSWQGRTDVFAGGNMFVYYSLEQARNRDYKGPDFFVVKGVDRSRQRRSWIAWQEGGGILMSSSNSFLRLRLRRIWDPRRICTNRFLRPSSIFV